MSILGEGFQEASWVSKTRDFDFNKLVQNTSRFYNADNFTTELSVKDQVSFDKWVTTMRSTKTEDGTRSVIHPKDTFSDYDMQGYWLNNVKDNSAWKPSANGHFSDEFKKPSHPTFSVESRYATKEYLKYAGRWSGDEYHPASITLKAVRMEERNPWLR